MCVCGHFPSIMAHAYVQALLSHNGLLKEKDRSELLPLISQIFQTNNFGFVPASANPLSVPLSLAYNYMPFI